jgi:hypothetical protein
MADRLLLEDGSTFLLEDGTAALLESATPAPRLGPDRLHLLLLIARRRRPDRVPGPAELLPSLPQSIVKRVESIPDLIDRLPGGFWFGTPDVQAINNPPYGSLNWIGEQSDYVTRRRAPGEVNAGPVKAGKRTVFQVTLIGPDFEVLDSIHDTWEDYFHPAMDPLQIRRRLFRSLFNQDPRVDFGDVPAGHGGYNPVTYHWTLEVITNTRPS